MRERIFNPSRETRTILNRAGTIGPAAQELCQTLFAAEGRVGQRKLWGIVGLADRYPRRLVDAACAQALHEGLYSYRHVKVLTEHLVEQALAQIDAQPLPASAPLTQDHPLIRSADIYAELFTVAAQAQLPLNPDPEDHPA